MCAVTTAAVECVSRDSEVIWPHRSAAVAEVRASYADQLLLELPRETEAGFGCGAASINNIQGTASPVQGGCDGPVPEELLEAWDARMGQPRPRLKPRQCLMLTPPSVLFMVRGQLWIDHLYFATAEAHAGKNNHLISTGYRDTVNESLLREGPCKRVNDVAVYVTDVTVHGRAGGGSETIQLLPQHFHTSISFLAQGMLRSRVSTGAQSSMPLTAAPRKRWASSPAAEPAALMAGKHAECRSSRGGSGVADDIRTLPGESFDQATSASASDQPRGNSQYSICPC